MIIIFQDSLLTSGEKIQEFTAMMNTRMFMMTEEQSQDKAIQKTKAIIIEWTKIFGIIVDRKRVQILRKNLLSKCGMNLMTSFNLIKDLKVQTKIILEVPTIKQKFNSIWRRQLKVVKRSLK